MTARISIMGDSQSDWVAGYGVRPRLMWPYVFGEILADQSPSISGPQLVRNWGSSGEAAQHNLNRCDIMQRWEVPDLACIYVGVNDAAFSIAQATTQANIQAIIKSLKYGAVGEGRGPDRFVLSFTGVPTGGTFTPTVWVGGVSAATAAQTYSASYTAATLQTALRGLSNVGGSNATVFGPNGGPFTIILAPVLGLRYMTVAASLTGGTSPLANLIVGPTVSNQAALPDFGKLGQRFVVMNDTSSNGGAAAWHVKHNATISGAGGGAQTVWEFRYNLAGELGWGRAAVASTAPFSGCCSRIMVVSTNYLNFTTGGDTPSTPLAANASVRVAQQAAVTAENVTVGGKATVVYCDLYAYQKARIQAGTDPDFSAVSYDQTKSWHVALNNQHHSAYGQNLVARAAFTALPAAWLTDLAAL